MKVTILSPLMAYLNIVVEEFSGILDNSIIMIDYLFYNEMDASRGGVTMELPFINKSSLKHVDDIYNKEGFESNVFNPMPARLFKFTSVNDYTIDNIMNDKISFSKVKTFNDYDDSISISKNVLLEMLYQHNIALENEYKRIFPSLDGIKLANYENMKGISDNQFKTLQSYANNLLVCCLSKGNNHSYMWGHYGDSNRGIAIEYEVDSFLDENAVGVTYSPNYFTNKANCINFFDDDKSIENIIYLNVFLKSDQWSFEEEYRIVLSLPFHRENYLSVKFNKPKSIILGKRFFEDFIDEQNKKIHHQKRKLLNILCAKDIKIKYIDSKEQGYFVRDDIVHPEIRELCRYFERFEDGKISIFQLEEIIERIFHTAFEYF